MMTNLVGQRISHYQITALLGQGRIGMVYQATDLETQEMVALKIVSLHLTQQRGFRERFLQEVQTIPRLDHPSIVKVHEAGVDTERDILYLTMEYVTGRSLTAHLERLQYRNEKLSLAEALQIGLQVAEALDYAHRKRVLHRDIRSNVILFKYSEASKEPRTVISDFSLMSLIEAETEPFRPSLPYLSPEQCLKRETDGRSDLYSLGIVLYELIVGQLPFTISSWEEAVRMHAYEDPPPPRRLRPELPANVEEILLKTIAKQPSQRFQSGDELADTLRHALALLPQTGATAVSSQIDDVITQTDIPPIVGLRATQWASDADRLTVTQDSPLFLNREIITIGRSDLNDITLNDNNVTRRHAQLERTAAGWQVRDLGSKNGTFLDEKRLLPDIPEEWLGHQTLRVGSHFLQMQRGKGFAFRRDPFSARISPGEMEAIPGKEHTLNLAVANNGETTLELDVQMERLPEAWFTLPGTIAIPPEGQVVVPLAIHPPLARDALPGKYRYLVVVRARGASEHQVSIPGVLDVQSAAAVFTLDLYPTILHQNGVSRLTIRNESIDATTYTILGQDADGNIRFGEWRPRAQASRAQAPQASGTTKTAVAPKTARGGRLLRQLPLVNRLRSAPRRWWYQVANLPRTALNRIMPGLGRMVPVAQMPQVSMPTTGGSGKTITPTPTPADGERPFGERPFPKRREVDEVMYPGELHTQLTIPGGQEGVIYLRVRPRRRPFFGRHNQTLPFTAQVSAGDRSRQTASGQLTVKPRFRTNISPAVILLLLILMVACSASLIVLSRYNQMAAAILALPRDADNDGLSNLAELYIYGTDPHRADSDGDGIPDATEIAMSLNPRSRDTDGDGLSDAHELALGTDPNKFDTDGDGLSDGFEYLELKTDPLIPNAASLPTPTPTVPIPPTPTIPPLPTPTLTPTPSVQQATLISQAENDGYLISNGSGSTIFLADQDTILVGDGGSANWQYKGIISFNTGALPASATIHSAHLRLRRGSDIGNPGSLGQLFIDISPANGFGQSMALAAEDADARAAIVGLLRYTTISGETWLEGALNDTGIGAISHSGVTQFRLYFTLPNNGNGEDDLLTFFAGDHANAEYRPQFVITYSVNSNQ